MMTRVYIAGPISKGDLRSNLDQAKEADRRLRQAGYAPLCPHLHCYLAGDSPTVQPHGIRHADWLDADLPWVMVADAVIRLPGESQGADLEVALAKELGIPVYGDGLAVAVVGAFLANPPKRGDERFHRLLRELALLHDRKQADYGRDEDAFANIRRSEDIGIPAWKGAWLRAKDKVGRIDTYCLKGSLSNEGVEDSLKDLAVYALIALIMHQETEADDLMQDASLAMEVRASARASLPKAKTHEEVLSLLRDPAKSKEDATFTGCPD